MTKALPPKFARDPASPTIYVEGLSQLQIGVPNSRMLFHSFASPASDDQPEIRNIACELVMPTNVLIETAFLLINNVSNAKEKIDPAFEIWTKRTTELLRSITPIKIEGMPEPTNMAPKSEPGP